MQSAAYSSSHLARGLLSPSIASAFKADFTSVFTCNTGGPIKPGSTTCASHPERQKKKHGYGFFFLHTPDCLASLRQKSSLGWLQRIVLRDYAHTCMRYIGTCSLLPGRGALSVWMYDPGSLCEICLISHLTSNGLPHCSFDELALVFYFAL